MPKDSDELAIYSKRDIPITLTHFSPNLLNEVGINRATEVHTEFHKSINFSDHFRQILDSLPERSRTMPPTIIGGMLLDICSLRQALSQLTRDT